MRSVVNLSEVWALKVLTPDDRMPERMVMELIESPEPRMPQIVYKKTKRGAGSSPAKSRGFGSLL